MEICFIHAYSLAFLEFILNARVRIKFNNLNIVQQVNRIAVKFQGIVKKYFKLVF